MEDMSFDIRGSLTNQYDFGFMPGKNGINICDPEEEGKLYEIRVYDEEEYLAAYLEMYLLPVYPIYSEAEDTVDLADRYDGEVYEAFSVLKNENLIYGVNGYSGYIKTLYVLPEYRRLGIGSKLLSFLDYILTREYGLLLISVAISPSLMEVEIERNSVNLLKKREKITDKDREMFEVMKANIIKVGFREAKSNGEYWVKAYEDEEGKLVD